MMPGPELRPPSKAGCLALLPRSAAPDSVEIKADINARPNNTVMLAIPDVDNFIGYLPPGFNRVEFFVNAGQLFSLETINAIYTPGFTA
jgi:hypothetical protein